MNAAKLKYVLIGCIVLMVVALLAGTIFLQRFLNEQVMTTDHAKIDAEASQQEIAKLQRLENELADKKDLLARAKQIAAASEQYRYQDQVINDLNVYASRNTIGIASFDFKQPAIGAAAQGNKTAFIVNLNSPIKYENLLAFLRDVEQNLTKIKVTSVNLSPNPKSPVEIQNPTINLEVFLKK